MSTVTCGPEDPRSNAKMKTINSCYKSGLPESSPMFFFTSQRFAYLLLITELHVTIVRLSHGTCSTPLSKSVCKSPSILLTKCSTRFIKSPGDYVKPCKISRPQWVNPCFIFSKFTENCIYIYVFINCKHENRNWNRKLNDWFLHGTKQNFFRRGKKTRKVYHSSFEHNFPTITLI